MKVNVKQVLKKNKNNLRPQARNRTSYDNLKYEQLAEANEQLLINKIDKLLSDSNNEKKLITPFTKLFSEKHAKKPRTFALKI